MLVKKKGGKGEDKERRERGRGERGGGGALRRVMRGRKGSIYKTGWKSVKFVKPIESIKKIEMNNECVCRVILKLFLRCLQQTNSFDIYLFH